jgi:hypothetical protein
MGIKDKMMDSMMGNMSAEEKKEMMDNMMSKFMDTMTAEEKQNMMNGMMDKFFGSMSPEEKQGMMSSMMPKMMGSMMGSDSNGGSPMMGMMKNMMGGMMAGRKDGDKNNAGSNGFNPMEMCQKMMGHMGKSGELAAYATPEVRALFEEWAEQIENEILSFIKSNNNADPDKIAEHFKLSKDSISFFISKLSQKGKITLKAEVK